MADPILEVQDLRLHYLTRFGEKIHAVDGVSFELKKGEILGIAGESGCGKTTLVSGLMGLYIPPLHHTSGEVRIDGKSIIGMGVERNRREVLGQKVAMIPQGALNSLNPTRKVKDLATDMILAHEEGTDKKVVYDRLRERFSRLGLDAEHVLNSYPVALPAGTKQRVVIGISTLLNPKVVIADEPTSALDVSTQKAVIRLLFELMDQGIVSSMLFITHELPLLRHVSSRIAVMYAGEFVELGTTEQVIFDGRQPYTRALMGSMLSAEPGQKSKKPVAIEGAPPNLAKPIKGCRFADRCPVARLDCPETKQVLRVVAGRDVRCKYAETTPETVGTMGSIALMTDSKFEAKDLSRTFGHGKRLVTAVDRVSFSIKDREIVSLVGQSGCGKTVLAKMLLRLEAPSSGELLFDGKPIGAVPDPRKHWRKVQAVFQDPFSAFNQFFTIRAQLKGSFTLFETKPTDKEMEERVDAALLAVNIKPKEVEGKYPFELSGGQMQRMLLARIFILRPQVLIADEPTSMVDACSRASILDYLMKLKEELSMTIVFVTHDIGLAYYVSDSIFIMHAGKIVEQGPPDQVTQAPSSDVTKKLLDDIPNVHRAWIDRSVA